MWHVHFEVETGTSRAVKVLTPIHSVSKVPQILFQCDTKTCDPSQFDLIVPEYAPLPNLLKKVAALIERSRALRAEAEISAERFHALLREAASLHEQCVTAGVESEHIRGAKFKRSVNERVNIPCVLAVDDNARWREMMCSMLKDYADCRLLCEAGDGIDAVQQATRLKPTLILLDLDLPRLNGIEAARQIMHVMPDFNHSVREHE